MLPMSTRRSSQVSTGSEPQSSVASGRRDSQHRPATASRVGARIEAVRALMVNTAPTGFQQKVADLMEWRKERISREKQGTEKLSVELLLAEIELHREQGRDAEADALIAALTADQPRRTPVIRLRDGQYLLEFV